ncbi:MAG: hypothetical protein OXH70_20680 [Acidobacteria bacterium]|nr:hypothetical protein [Acidobacteriota bacterium]
MTIARDFAAGEENRYAAAINTLSELVALLAGLDGPKILVHLTDGLAQRPGLSIFSYLVEQACPNDTERHSEAYSEMLQHDLSPQLEKLAHAANANRVTFFPIDTGGVRAGLNQDPSFSGSQGAPSPRNDYVHKMNAQSGMQLLAQSTGGYMLINSNDLAVHFDTIRKRLANTYLLTFVAPEVKPGQTHTVDLLLAPGGPKRRRPHYRRTYIDRSIDEYLGQRLLSTAYLGLEENPLRVLIRVGDTEALDRERFRLPIMLKVPEAELRRLTGTPRIELRVWLVAIDLQQRGRTAVRQKALAIGGPDGIAATDGFFGIRIVMELPAGEYSVAAGVLEEATGATTLIRNAVSVPRTVE